MIQFFFYNILFNQFFVNCFSICEYNRQTNKRFYNGFLVAAPCRHYILNLKKANKLEYEALSHKNKNNNKNLKAFFPLYFSNYEWMAFKNLPKFHLSMILFILCLLSLQTHLSGLYNLITYIRGANCEIIATSKYLSFSLRCGGDRPNYGQVLLVLHVILFTFCFRVHYWFFLVAIYINVIL